MSQNLAEDWTTRHGQPPASPAEPYRKLTAWAVASLVFGVLSMATAFDWVLGLLPVIGIFLGLGALQRIDRAPGELTGARVAKAGMVLSVFFWIAGYGWLSYLHFADVPPGYHGISYDLLQPPPEDKLGEPPPAAKELDGKRVFIKGYMYPGRQMEGISQFALVPTINHCQFCMPQLKPTEVIQIKLIHGIKAKYKDRLRGVGGIFHIRSKDEKEPGLLYQMEADYLQ